MNELFEKYRSSAEVSRQKYVELRNVLAEAIFDGFFKPGEKLPTDAKMAEGSPYSLGTVQRAYGLLVREGLIERRRGAGSFVSIANLKMPDPWHCRFLSDDGDTLLPVFPTVISHEVIKPDARVRAALGTERSVGHIDRLLSIGGEFNVLSRFYASRAVSKPLMDMPIDALQIANFKTVIMRAIREAIYNISQTMQLIRIDAPEADLLGNPAGTPFILIESTAHRQSGEPVYFQKLFVPETDKRLIFESKIGPFNL